MSSNDPLTVHAEPTDGNKLVGWKDIAAYLGKGLRTAQRWEKEFGLPVRRVGRDGGEIVFAFRAEIDAWLRREEGLRARRADLGATGQNGHAEPVDNLGEDSRANGPARREAGPAAPVVDAAPQAPPARGLPAEGHQPARDRKRRHWVARAIGLAAVVSAAALWPFVRPAHPGRPSAWTVAGRTFSVYDGQGRHLWSHEFSRHLDEMAYEKMRRSVWPQRHVQIADLDADGDPEVAVARRDDLRENRQFFLFGADGRVRVIRRVEVTRHFGDSKHSPPWLAHAALLTENVAAPPTMWFVHVSMNDYATLLEAVDAHGRPQSAYWSNGYIDFAKAARIEGRDLVFAGGANNETGGAALAVFEKGKVNGSAPAERAAYRCTDCPTGGPLAFVVFPRLCMLRAKGLQASILNVLIAESGDVTVEVLQDSLGSPVVYYRLDSRLRLSSVEISAGYEEVHAAGERSGELDHSFSAMRQHEEEAARKVLRWDGTRFVDVEWAPGVTVTPPADPSRND